MNCADPNAKHHAGCDCHEAVHKHEVSSLREQLQAEHDTAIDLFIDLHELKNSVKILLDVNGRHNTALAFKRLRETYEQITTP
jgi:hypothetical protein